MNNVFEHKKPLEGKVIIDLTRVRAGPTATKLMVEQGARVIKVESEDGDPTRGYGPLEEGNDPLLFEWLNTGKESVVINLKTQEGKQLFLDMVALADVVIENFSPGVMDRLGIGYETLKQINPDIVYTSISGYGQEGPSAKKPAFNTAIGAESGFMVSNNPKENPQLDALLAADTIGGQLAFSSTLAALIHRDKYVDGGSTQVDISMMDVMAYLQSYQVAMYGEFGEPPLPNGEDHLVLCPVGKYGTKDKEIVISAASNIEFHKFATAIERPDLINSDLYNTMAKRTENSTLLRKEIETVLVKNSSEYWLKLFNDLNISASSINGVEDLIFHPQLSSRNSLLPVEGKNENMRIPKHPINFTDTELQSSYRPAPKKGEHDDKIKSEVDNGSLGSRRIDDKGTAVHFVKQRRQPDEKNEPPLKGLVVLDIGRFHSAGNASKMLQEQGARVIKIEDPNIKRGIRDLHPKASNDMSVIFNVLNHGKESIFLDLKTERAYFLELVKQADVVIENFAAGKMAELGLSYEDLKEANPHIILTSISGYGQTGPYSTKKAFNSTLEAESGYMATDNPEGDAKLDALMSGSKITGQLAYSGTLSAIIARNNNEEGLGSHVDVAMIEVLTYLQGLQVAEYTAHKTKFYPDGIDQITSAPVGIFPTDNGNDHIVFSAGPQAVFERLCKSIYREDLIDDERFANSKSRFTNRKILRQEIEDTLATNTTDYWHQQMNEHRVPNSPVNTINDLVEHQQLKFRNTIGKIEGTNVLLPHHPVKSNLLERNPNIKPPPKAGEHTETVRNELRENDTLGSKFLDGRRKKLRGDISLI